ncbi:hypothetical protein evm_009307 [Chilo suppressalis]|nr:hypothetical protein evm_009307 [Chilo suppressalis]
MESYNIQAPSKAKMAELQAIMTKMPFEVCCVTVLPEFELKWRDVSRAVRNARLPMTSASVARVICRHAARSLQADDVDDIIASLRLKRLVGEAGAPQLCDTDDLRGRVVCTPGFMAVADSRGLGFESRWGHMYINKRSTGGKRGRCVIMKVKQNGRSSEGALRYSVRSWRLQQC